MSSECADDSTPAFLNAMRELGVVPTDPSAVCAGGELIRFHVEGDRHGSANGWCVLHSFPSAGAFGSWRTGASGTWSSGVEVSSQDRGRIRADVERAKANRCAEREREQSDARASAERLWQRAVSAVASHSYLQAKGVQVHGLRQDGARLLVPMRDTGGGLWALQTINSAGDKRFLKGSRKRGLYHAIGAAVADILLIAEGYATAATLHESTGHPTACAFDAGNLEPVAIELRAKHPTARIIICADNDAETAERTGRNPGVEAATRAARAVQGVVALPKFRA